MLKGHATAEGTTRFRKRLQGTIPSGHFRECGDLWLSSIGFGTYLGKDDDAEEQKYREAAPRAAALGVNVVDTAINYRGQRSERNIGKALAELFESAEVQRDEIIIATKGGFIPFEEPPPADVSHYIDVTYVETHIAASEDFVGHHCMAPDYLWHQIEQSRQNLGIDCIDIFYLHNPEAQLEAISRNEFRKRIETAVRFLEDQVLGITGGMDFEDLFGLFTLGCAVGYNDYESLSMFPIKNSVTIDIKIQFAF